MINEKLKTIIEKTKQYYNFRLNKNTISTKMLDIGKICLCPSSTECLVIMTATLEISIKIRNSAKYIIGILSKIIEISPENLKNITKISKL